MRSSFVVMIKVRAEIHGFNAKELELSVEPHRLTTTGQRESKEDRKAQKPIYSDRHSDEKSDSDLAK